MSGRSFPPPTERGRRAPSSSPERMLRRPRTARTASSSSAAWPIRGPREPTAAAAPVRLSRASGAAPPNFPRPAFTGCSAGASRGPLLTTLSCSTPPDSGLTTSRERSSWTTASLGGGALRAAACSAGSGGEFTRRSGARERERPRSISWRSGAGTSREGEGSLGGPPRLMLLLSRAACPSAALGLPKPLARVKEGGDGVGLLLGTAICFPLLCMARSTPTLPRWLSRSTGGHAGRKYGTACGVGFPLSTHPGGSVGGAGGEPTAPAGTAPPSATGGSVATSQRGAGSQAKVRAWQGGAQVALAATAPAPAGHAAAA